MILLCIEPRQSIVSTSQVPGIIQHGNKTNNFILPNVIMQEVYDWAGSLEDLPLHFTIQRGQEGFGGLCGVRSVENAACGKCGVWKTELLYFNSIVSSLHFHSKIEQYFSVAIKNSNE